MLRTFALPARLQRCSKGLQWRGMCSSIPPVENNNENGASSRFLALAEETKVKDGDVELEFICDLNPTGVGLRNEDKIAIFDKFLKDPIASSIPVLSSQYRVSVERIEAVIVLKGLEQGMTIPEIKAKVEELKQAKLSESESGSKKSGKAQDTVKVESTQQDELEMREPNFFFLNDDFEELPPIHRQFGKRKPSDKISVDEAVNLQAHASKNKITLLPSFAKNQKPNGKWKIAIKDISRKKAPLYMRDIDGSLRLATDEEVVKRTWVKRPSFFKGIERF